MNMYKQMLLSCRHSKIAKISFNLLLSNFGHYSWADRNEKYDCTFISVKGKFIFSIIKKKLKLFLLSSCFKYIELIVCTKRKINRYYTLLILLEGKEILLTYWLKIDESSLFFTNPFYIFQL